MRMHPVALASACTLALAAAACEEQTSSSPPDGSRTPAASRAGNASPALRNVEVRSSLRTMADALQAWRLTHGGLPDDVRSMIDAGALPESATRDPWGNPIRFERAGRGAFRVWTVGPDGEDGTGDDVEITR